MIGQFFSRRDQLLEYIAKTDQQIVAVLVAWLKAQDITVPPSLEVTVEVPTIPTVITPETAQVGIGVRVTPSPTGEIVAKGNLAASTTAFQTVAEYTVTKGKRFQLAKIVASCSEDIIVQVYWGAEAISIPYFVMAKLPFTDWFPINYYLTTHEEYLKGNGNTKILLKAKYPSGGSAAEVDGEIVGEETDVTTS